MIIVTEGRSIPLADDIHSRQMLIIENAEALMDGETLKPEIKQAFLNTPRHAFAPRFQDGRPGLWSEVDDTLLSQSLGPIYADAPYCIYRDQFGEATSTISQPSLVLYMLQLLDLKAGHRVFELGGGSGWNAALMSRLVGTTGEVLSIEIESALIENSRRALDNLGIGNVSLLLGDGSQPPSDVEKFDRGIFTASSWSLPEVFFDLIRESGLLLFVLKIHESSDLLLALRKTSDHFVSERQIHCRFVSLTGNRDFKPVKGGSKEQTFEDWIRTSRRDLEKVKVSVYRANAAPPNSKDSFMLTRDGNIFVWNNPS